MKFKHTKKTTAPQEKDEKSEQETKVQQKEDEKKDAQ